MLYTDSLIGQLVRELEAAAAERDVLLLVTSDRGDEFLEHGGLGHGSTLDRAAPEPEIVQRLVALGYIE